MDVATGQIIAPSIGPTRTEVDLATHITQTIQTDQEAACSPTKVLLLLPQEPGQPAITRRTALTQSQIIKGLVSIGTYSSHAPRFSGGVADFDFAHVQAWGAVVCPTSMI